MARDSCRRRGKGSAVLNAAVLAACMHASQAFTVSPALRSMAPFPFKSLTGPRGGGRPALAARGGIFGLRAQYVPLDDALILQEDPDHPVLKDPARLKIRKTEEEVTTLLSSACAARCSELSINCHSTPPHKSWSMLRDDSKYCGDPAPLNQTNCFVGRSMCRCSLQTNAQAHTHARAPELRLQP